MEAVVVSGQLGWFLVTQIGRQFTYLYKYKRNIETLKKEVEKLKDARDRVHDMVHDAKRNGEEINQLLIDWQQQVESIILKAEYVIQKQENDPRCFNQLRPNLMTRYKDSRRAYKIWIRIDPMLQEEKEVAYRYNPHALSKDYLAFESRNSTMKNVWIALNDAKIDMIGVHGMRGLGKTVLAQEVGRQAMKHKFFDEMVFIDVTEFQGVNNIQAEIANQLRIQFDKESERANKLYERLNNSKKILLILDNIWEHLDLKTIGIPSGSDHGGCKLLLTTSEVDVLETMGATNIFGMGFLTEEEAWRLFKKVTGNIATERVSNTIQHDVLNECGGLPSAIDTIARKLRGNRDQSQWEDVLKILRSGDYTL